MEPDMMITLRLHHEEEAWAMDIEVLEWGDGPRDVDYRLLDMGELAEGGHDWRVEQITELDDRRHGIIEAFILDVFKDA